MAGSIAISLIIAIASSAVVFLLSIPALTQYVQRIRKGKTQYLELSDHYEDKDGVATEDSESRYTDFIPRLSLLLVSAVGTIDTLVFAVILTTKPLLNLEQWLQFGTWMLLLLQAITIFTDKSSVTRYNLGFATALSSLVVLLAVAIENISLWQMDSPPLPRNIHLTFSLIQWFAALVLMLTALSIPRRPDVYRDGQVVDSQNTVSFLSKLTFTWPAPILLHAAKNKGLEYTDIPDIDHYGRSQTLRKGFESVPKQDKLWKTLFLAHRSGFLTQWLLQAIVSFTNFLPQIALFFLLRTLEARDAGENVGLKSWLLVIALGSADITSTWVENWMFYVSFCRVGTPIYEQLTTIVFGKSIRRKDVKGVAKGTEEEKTPNGHLTPQEGDSASKDDKNEEDDDETVQKTRQSIVNLAAVDAKRIADFANFNYIFLGSVIKLAVAITFLIKLIGFLPMLAGFVAPALITPLNVYVSRIYGKAQDDLMKHRDQKMSVVTEALQGIRQIKFSALEKEWYEKILATRRKELNTQWKVFLCDTCLISIWIFGPVMLSAISLMVYAAINKELSASVAFTTISVFEAIEMTLAIVPEMFTDLLDSLVSAGRIQKYLDSPEKEDGTSSGQRIEFQDATIAWPSDEPEIDDQHFALRHVDLKFPDGELSTISGRTGSGKSLLLSSIIGEAEVLEGKVTVPRPLKPAERYDAKATKQDWLLSTSIAYVAQIPWIENATIKDNILFGLPYDDARYKTVVDVCALEKDLEMLEDGDLTDIGANGINLSGGQKWRVSFARALYSRAGILILDDIFSAVDANVGRHLYEKALTGDLGKGRTRILVTHHVALTLPKTKYSVLLADGGIEAAGATEELRRSGKLESILAYDIEVQKKEEEAAEEAVVDDGGHLSTVLSHQSRRGRKPSNLSAGTPDLQRKRSHATIEEAPKPAPKKFTEDEGRETGAIRWSVYNRYIKASGGFSYWALIALVFGAWILIYLARSYWISVWTRSYRTEATLTISLIRQPGHVISHLRNEFSAMELDSQLLYYLGVYLGISLLAWIVGSIKYFFIFLASIRASKVLFEGLAFTVLRAPLRWLDTVPVGRVLNRFTADFNMLDSKIAFDMSFFLHNTMHVVSVIIAGIFVSPFMIVFAVILLAISAFYATRYLAAAREIKRLESNAKSPVFEQIGSVLTGIATIRAFDKTDTYIQRMYQKVDLHCRCYYFLMVFNRWMSFRLNVVGAMFAVVTAALVVSIRRIDASLAGFALSFALQLAESVIWMLRQYTQVELDSNATERIIEYSTMPTENQGGTDAPAAWPTKGEVEVDNLVVGYAADLPPVLKGLTFSVKQNERVGVVGRTGAGKSSLTLALFRFLEARSGSIYIDGIDISKITLHDLRSRLAIIPQDPVLFSGTVRSNLDPFDQHTDIELREALARVHLISSPTATASGSATPVPQTPIPGTPSETNKNIFRSLSSKIAEGGLNLSQGQRQLLCLARAIVSHPKVMVLDEATSAVDMDTDALIQRSIREEFGDATLLVIAHRLSTIADFDRILVMGEGEAKEFGTPRELMGREGGVFRSLVEESGERGTLEGIIFGEKS
jgi:ABC-type multidrug transport system fused ATPase/permease subunit